MKLRKYALTGYALALVVGVSLVAGYAAVEMSSAPVFCGSCHIMKPYYDSWQASSHDQVKCVDCHIAPGLFSEVEKKYEAVSMVARYFTGTYGDAPWAEVDDSACLECHERRLLQGEQLFGSVHFDHRPHLVELRRGKKLRCTSCHSQIVQGSHITVTSTTCTLCHFAGATPGEGTAECTSCHDLGLLAGVHEEAPDPARPSPHAMPDHAEVARLGMDCQSCHPPPPATAGRVPRERCLTCHNSPERLAAYDDGEGLHRAHVTDHKVECTNCHLEIDHSPERHATVEAGSCGSCHGGLHSAQHALYAGTGGVGVEPRPAAMFTAGVRCEGCHRADLPGHGDGPTATADELACMSCHGPGVRTVLGGWKRTVEERSRGLRRQLDRTARALPAAALEPVEANLELVELGHGVHNVPYSLDLLEAAHERLNAARRERGLTQLAVPWTWPDFDSACLDCHAGIESAAARVFGRRFEHAPHVLGAGLECESCHATHEARDAGAEALQLVAGDCNACHHTPEAAADCRSCHAGVFERTFEVAELGDFDHALHVDDMELACSDCHGEGSALVGRPDPAICSDCH